MGFAGGELYCDNFIYFSKFLTISIFEEILKSLILTPILKFANNTKKITIFVKYL
jgi:hypothetical protein